MMYYSNEARVSAIRNINSLIDTINHIPGNVLSFSESSDIAKYLNQYKNEIIKEGRASHE